jgi:hypothetical protein
MKPRLLVATIALGAIVAHAACGDSSHVFEGRLFVEERGCLGTTSSLDTVSGEGPGQCPATCLAQPLRDGGRAIYVATMCAPYPFGFDTSGTDPACPAALAAFGRNDTCLLDGGSANPQDASTD